MKRILFISHYLNRAGIEAFMMSVFRGVDHSRFRVDFLLYNQMETDYTREVEAAGSKVWRVPCRRQSPLGWYRSLNRFFREHASEYAAVHFCGNSFTAIAPLFFAYRYGVPIRISHAHSSSSEGFHNRLFHILKRRFASCITTHHFACSSLAAKWFYGDAPAVIIKNGIDTRRFAYDETKRNSLRERFGISKSTRVIGHVGRFENEKNHTFIVDVFARYLQINPDAKLMLVGVGSLMEQTLMKAQALSIDDKVVFLGERADVNELMQAFDLFLMPSTFEGQPFVLIEAQCAGLPCLLSDVINDDIILTENVVKLPLDMPVRKWAEQINEMLKDFQRKDESNAIERQGYSIRTTIDYLEKVYSQEKIFAYFDTSNKYNSVYQQTMLLLERLERIFSIKITILDRTEFQQHVNKAGELVLMPYECFKPELVRLRKYTNVVFIYHNITPAKFFWKSEPLVGIKSVLGHLQLRFLRHFTKHWVAVSEYNRKELESYGYRNVLLCSNMIKNAKVEGEKTSEPSMLYVGRIVQNKKSLELLQAAMKTAEIMGRRITLYVVGSGKKGSAYLRQFHEWIETHAGGLLNVRWLNGLTEEELAALYHRCWLYVSLSQHEGFGLPVCESINYGTPAIYTRCGGQEMVLDNVGLVDEERIPQYAAELLSDEKKLAGLYDRQLHLVKAFTIPNYDSVIEKVFAPFILK